MPNDRNNLHRESKKKLMESFRGWYYWHNLVKKYDMKGENANTAVVLLPRHDDENCYYALLYLDRMLSLRRFNAAILLTVTPIITEIAQIFSEKLLAVEILDNGDADALLQYYELMVFDPRFIAASLDEPNGRNGRALIGISDITAEEMVAIGVYRIVPYVQKKRPVYQGENPEIIKFMEVAEPYCAKRTERVIQ